MRRLSVAVFSAVLAAALLFALSARAEEAATETPLGAKTSGDRGTDGALNSDPVVPYNKLVLLAQYTGASSQSDYRALNGDVVYGDNLRAVFGQIGYGNFEFSPKAPIGLEHPLTNRRILSAISLDDDDDAMIGGGGFIFDVTREIPPLYLGWDEGVAKRSFVTGGFNFYNTGINQRWSMFDPYGQTLLLPGTGDSWANYPQGVALPAGVPLGTAGGYNVIDRLAFRHDYDAFTGYLKWGQLCPRPGFTIGGFGGFAYTGADLNETFGGEIPGYMSHFRYRTDVDIQTVTPLLGLIGIVPIDGVHLIGTAHAGLDITDVNGDDYFRLSGSLNDSQHVTIDDDKTGVNLGATIGVRIPVKGFNITIGAAYQHNENYPEIVRTGETGARTGIHFSDQQFWAAGIQLGLDLDF